MAFLFVKLLFGVPELGDEVIPMAAMLIGGKLLSPASPVIEIEGKYEGDPNEGAASSGLDTMLEDGDFDFNTNGGTFATCPFEIRCLASVHNCKTFEGWLTAFSSQIFPVLFSIETLGDVDDLKSRNFVLCGVSSNASLSRGISMDGL